LPPADIYVWGTTSDRILPLFSFKITLMDPTLMEQSFESLQVASKLVEGILSPETTTSFSSP
jgi:hypothetical protein